VTTYGGVAAIPASQRATLLGDLAALDPGACTTAPDWDQIKIALKEARITGRLRSNWCLGSPTDPAEQSVTVGAELLVPPAPEPDGGDPLPGHAAAKARPWIERIEASYVAPVFDDSEIGYSPWGLDTGNACETDADCPAELGQRCGGFNHCMAYPVIDRDSDLRIRGWNFWDSVQTDNGGSMRLRYQRVDDDGDPDNDTYTIVATGGIDVTENGSDSVCYNPEGVTDDRAHFPVPVDPGFYRLTLYNHNGHFLTHHEADTDDHPEPGRTIHVCYPASLGSLDGLDSATPRDCTTPTETCPMDGEAPGGTCHAGWPTPPRPLEGACHHGPDEAPPCAETPEWFASEPWYLNGTPIAPIVYVRAAPPTYTLRVSMEAGECMEESGSDRWGSDEVMTAVLGFAIDPAPTSTDGLIAPLEKDVATYMDGDADTGEREHVYEPRLLSKLEGVALTDEISYLLLVVEADSTYELWRDFVVVEITTIATAVGGAAGGGWGALGAGTAGALLSAWVYDAWTKAGEDDIMGVETVHGTIADMLQLDTINSGPQFLEHPWPSLPEETELGLQTSVVEQPTLTDLIGDPWIGMTFPIECSPGTCSNGKVCFAQRCYAPEYIPVDEEGNGRFQDRHHFAGGTNWHDSYGYEYGVDLLWTIEQE
jgi:hypothetical protein